MKTLLKMAWLNIWRNKRRALILLCSMTAGLMGVTLSMALSLGWLNQLKNNAVRTFEGHVKIFGQGYQDNPVIEHPLVPPRAILSFLNQDSRVRAWAQRVVIQGLLSTPAQSVVVRIVGIDPDQERDVSILADAVLDGAYLAPDKPHQILIGRRLADRLKLGLGKKVVLMSQQRGGDLGSGAYRVAGIFDTGNGSLDDQVVYILKGQAQQMLDLENRITEIVVLLQDIHQSDRVASDLARLVRGEPVEVFTWKALLPFIVQVIKLSGRIMIPYYAIFYIAMAFGIVNTLLMSIGERTHEIGVMRAIGMRQRRLVMLILLESTWLALVAVLFSSLLSWTLVSWLETRGINLSMLSEGMDYLGVGRILYPALHWTHLLAAGLVALAVSLVFSAYPAARAARLVPVQAIRRVG